ncbi:hypothetical protein [Mesorhizobium sp. M1272]|uniref:hypothetical protein n=1 Tax=Mesorhizobium sp. M1272 TaxID=2957074 RepID=UPI0033387514
MDIIGTLLSILGMGRDHANRVSDRRMEVARLNAEIAAEFGRSLDVLRAGRLGLLRRCAIEHPHNPEIAAELRKVLDPQEEDILKVMKMTEGISEKVISSGWSSNWELALQKAHEMRGTASRSVPFIEGILYLTAHGNFHSSSPEPHDPPASARQTRQPSRVDHLPWSPVRMSGRRLRIPSERGF